MSSKEEIKNQMKSQMTPPLQSPGSDSTSATSSDNNAYQYIFKIVLIGDSNTGKTSLIHRFVNRAFDEKYLCTIGVDFFMKTVNVDGNVVKLQIWDTAGMEKYRSISSSYYRGSHSALVIFDLTAKSTFENVTKWLEAYYKSSSPQYKKNIILIGNKVDLESNREVKREEAESYAKDNQMLYWETSAKEGSNVDEVFNFIAKNLYDNYKDEYSNTMDNYSALVKDSGSTDLTKSKCC